MLRLILVFIALKEAEFPAKRELVPSTTRKGLAGLLSSWLYKRPFMRIVSACTPFIAVLVATLLAVTPAAAEVILARYAVSLVGFRIGEASAHGAVSRASRATR